MKFLETDCEEFCFLSAFLSQVILLAYCLSFKMRYWGGLCDFRKNYRSCFWGYPCPNSIVNAKCKDSYFSFEWSKWVGKKILRKNYISSQLLFSVLFWILKFKTCIFFAGSKVMNPQMPLWNYYSLNLESYNHKDFWHGNKIEQGNSLFLG